MPIDKSYFTLIPEDILNAPRFARRLIRREYEGWLENSLISANRGGAILPRDLSTFSEDLGLSAQHATNYLRYLGTTTHRDRYDLDDQSRRIIQVYSMNSLPFHAITRGWDLGARDSYQDLDPVYIDTYFPNRQVGLQSVAALNDVLRSIPVLNVDEFDVSYWSQGYSGQMVFRGALTLPNQATSDRFDGAIYQYDSGMSGRDNVISVGNIVTNTDFMSTSAHPSVACEFVIRQAYTWAGEQTSSAISINCAPRRVFFRIEMRYGRNITPWTVLDQAEILFPTRSLFRVREIVRGEHGLMVHLEELTNNEAAGVTQAKNMFTGHGENIG